MSEYVLTIDGGSSSIKFALYQIGELLEQRLAGKVDRMLLKRTRLEGIRAHGQAVFVVSRDYGGRINA